MISRQTDTKSAAATSHTQSLNPSSIEVDRLSLSYSSSSPITPSILVAKMWSEVEESS